MSSCLVEPRADRSDESKRYFLLQKLLILGIAQRHAKSESSSRRGCRPSQQLFTSPVLVPVKPRSAIELSRRAYSHKLPAVGEIPPDHQRNLAFSQLLDSNLKWICLTLHIDKDWRIHAIDGQPAISKMISPCSCLVFYHSPDLQRPCP
jgi:hypothetical protein